MKVTLLLIISALCLLSSGCALSDNLIHTSIIEPLHFSGYWDGKRQHHHFRKLAMEALEQARATARAESDNYTCEPFSIDEERGFQDGFVDFLMYGGAANLPTLPPRRYWGINYQNPDGYQAIQDWFNGFQHGAAAAQASGYREFVTLALNDSLVIDKLPIYPQLTNIENIESDQSSDEMPSQSGIIESERSSGQETNEEKRPGILVAAPDRLPPTPPTADKRRHSNTGFPPPKPAVPATVNPLPPVDPFPVIKERDSSGFDRSNDVDQGLSVPPGLSTNRLPPVEPESQQEFLPPVNRQQAIPPLGKPAPVRSLPPLARKLPGSERGNLFETPGALLPDTHQASAISPEAFSDFAELPEVALTSFSQVEPLNERKNTDLESAIDSRVRPRWSIAAVGLLFLAGITFLVRQRRRFPTVAIQRHPQPHNPGVVGASPTFQTHRIHRRWSPKRPGIIMRTINRLLTRMHFVIFVTLASCLTTGCASLTNPVLNGIPVHRLPTEYLVAPNRERLQTIPLSLLRQEQPEDYILAAGDVIGVLVAGVFPLTSADQPLPAPPVYFPSQIDPLGAGLPPSLGYPVTIRNDGTMALPLVEPILLDGLTIEEANERVRKAYIDKGILQPGREAVMLTLMQPRQIRILVFRQEVGGFSAGGRGDIAGNNVKQGTGHIVDLRAYENDVVNALANTGGLPGLDAYDGVFIFRGGQSNLELAEKLNSLPSGEDLSEFADLGVKTDYIPTRWAAGEPLPFEPEDAILHDGDVLLLEARVQDLFYTGGLLPSGEQRLPRDYDLDVLEAVAQVRGTLVNGAFGGNNVTGRLIQQGAGNPNPSALTVVRRTPDGGQISIRVDLNRALKDPRERILIQPDDLLILQETRGEGVARYMNDVFNFNIFWRIFAGSSGQGITGVTQLPTPR